MCVIYTCIYAVNGSFKLDPGFNTKSEVYHQLYAQAMNPTSLSWAYMKGLGRLVLFM